MLLESGRQEISDPEGTAQAPEVVHSLPMANAPTTRLRQASDSATLVDDTLEGVDVPGSSVPYTTATARAHPVPRAAPAQFPPRFALTRVAPASQEWRLARTQGVALVVKCGHVP